MQPCVSVKAMHRAAHAVGNSALNTSLGELSLRPTLAENFIVGQLLLAFYKQKIYNIL